MSTEGIGLKHRVHPRPIRAAPFVRDWIARWNATACVRVRFALLAAGADAAAITVSALVVGVAYHSIYYQVGGMAGTFVRLGLVMSILFGLFNQLRNDYEIPVYMTFAGHGRLVLMRWNLAFLTALVLMFATKDTAEYSRVSIALFYVAGFLSIIVVRAALVHRVRMRVADGVVSAIRVVLVGTEAAIEDFISRYQPWSMGVDVMASSVLRGADTLTDDLALAAASARILRPDDIFILVPWTDDTMIEACIKALTGVPAAVHLGPHHVLDRFAKAKVSRIGSISSLNLVNRPLTSTEISVKRAFDLVGATTMLIALLPVFCLVALAIKLDTRGPVFFLQRRYGFNQKTFRIVKFRSMTVAEDGRLVRQATREDPRVTRVGRFLRRYNLDELPQLVNVIRGEMSLVGPRPHALVHNQQYERSIADYARRHNMKPGITGLAQVHGFRGEITSEEAMLRRVEHDLYYLDNWTLGLDIRILGMTLLSAKALENAY